MMKKIIVLLLLFTSKSFSQKFDYSDYNSFLSKYVSEKGNVNYDKIKKNIAELEIIVDQFSKNQPTNKNWTKKEELAYFINTYNVYTLKIVVDNYPTKSIKDINKAWDKKTIPSYKALLSLSDIEHKILRKLNEPRIHFAINCASVSCPNLENKAFEPSTLENQLESATKSFINDKTKNLITEKEIKISEIFNWFASDFKVNGSVIDYINKYATTKIDKKAKIKYLEYNWSLNK
jgi:Protein of unknown function, DUF547